MAKKAATHYIVIDTQYVDGDDGPVLVREGTVFPADHPFVVKNPYAFRADLEPPVETATAEPGEKRQVRRSK